MKRKERTTLHYLNEIILSSGFTLQSVMLNKTNTGRDISFYLCFISTKSYATVKKDVFKMSVLYVCVFLSTVAFSIRRKKEMKKQI